MDKKRSGILMHISSLPNKYGIGCFSKEAYEFVVFLKESKFSIWQILPLNVTSFGDSPYQSPSSAGLNYYFIDLEKLMNDSLLTKNELKEYKEKLDAVKSKRVNYGFLYENRIPLLKLAFSRFDRSDKEFGDFESQEKYVDFAGFMTLKEVNNQKMWIDWDDRFKHFDNLLINEIKEKYSDLFYFYLWTQFEFLKEYKALKEYANKNGILIMGDIPIYVAYDSVDVLKNPELFDLTKELKPKHVAGCPPDMFSENGQLWGNPIYNWPEHKKVGYKWWNERIKGCLELYDLLRIDHFRGFSAYYSIPGEDKTAKNGVWVKGPGADLFKDKLDYPIVAEDLGMMDDDFYKMMDECKYPGMRLAHQCFDYEGRDGYWRPSNYTRNYFAYTTSHDSCTFVQYIEECDKKRFAMMKRILKDECKLMNVEYHNSDSKKYITDKTIELCLKSDAQAAIFPMQDLLYLGKEARMNYPSSISVLNWSRRMDEKVFKRRKIEMEIYYSNLNKKYGRF